MLPAGPMQVGSASGCESIPTMRSSLAPINTGVHTSPIFLRNPKIAPNKFHLNQSFLVCWHVWTASYTLIISLRDVQQVEIRSGDYRAPVSRLLLAIEVIDSIPIGVLPLEETAHAFDHPAKARTETESTGARHEKIRRAYLYVIAYAIIHRPSNGSGVLSVLPAAPCP